MRKKLSNLPVDHSRRTVTYRSARSRGFQGITMTLIVVGTILGAFTGISMLIAHEDKSPMTSSVEMFDGINVAYELARSYGRFVTDILMESTWAVIRLLLIITVVAGFALAMHASLKSDN